MQDKVIQLEENKSQSREDLISPCHDEQHGPFFTTKIKMTYDVT